MVILLLRLSFLFRLLLAAQHSKEPTAEHNNPNTTGRKDQDRVLSFVVADLPVDIVDCVLAPVVLLPQSRVGPVVDQKNGSQAVGSWAILVPSGHLVDHWSDWTINFLEHLKNGKILKLIIT